MLVLVLRESELYQNRWFQYVCCENFQIQLQEITFLFERTNHNNCLDLYFEVIPL